MAKIPEKELIAIEQIVQRHGDGITAKEISQKLPDVKYRTLQYRLQQLVSKRRLVTEGTRRSTKYRIPEAEQVEADRVQTTEAGESVILALLSDRSLEIRKRLQQPLQARAPVGYNRGFLDSYQPNVTFYLSTEQRAHLDKIGRPKIAQQPAGTYAKQILNRLLIDFSWSSSRLEGNTYSILDTRRLIDWGHEAEGKDRLEAQMILNHKDAIEFLVNGADQISFNRYTILNTHAMLANNLLDDPAAAGRLRRIAVSIEGSAFHSLEIPQLIEECFDQILATAAAIENPFEQSLFAMVQLPYLQPFDDVNKRLSRLASNIPFIKANLIPLSFIDVPTDLYREALLGVYELNEVDLLKEIFIWAYDRSAERYAAVRQSLGEPDPFKLRYRASLRQIVVEIVRGPMGKKRAAAYLAEWSKDHIESSDRDTFREVVENELMALHEGNFARYQVRPSEFEKWQEVWRVDPAETI